jgi:hypothetical protein
MPLAVHCGMTRLGDITGPNPIGVPVAMVTRPNAQSVSVSQGKGLTFAAAPRIQSGLGVLSGDVDHIALAAPGWA